jgi:hypothetical protein
MERQEGGPIPELFHRDSSFQAVGSSVLQWDTGYRTSSLYLLRCCSVRLDLTSDVHEGAERTFLKCWPFTGAFGPAIQPSAVRG